MKRLKYLLIILMFFLFMPNIKAADCSYEVKAVGIESSQIGCYDNYSEALDAMNHYDNNVSKVAAIYYNGALINAYYAIAKINVDKTTVNLYKKATDSVKYTYISPAYGTEAAFIDYDPTTNRVKLMISGFTGWIDYSNVTIVPISDMVGDYFKVNVDSINVRVEATTASSSLGYVTNGQMYKYSGTYNDGTYTWYTISYNNQTGYVACLNTASWLSTYVTVGLQTYYNPYRSNNLIHYYQYYNSGNYLQSFTNIGPNPSYLEIGTRYYSFDGNYFYTNILDMLYDYKSGSHSKALNKDNPFYAYYQYLPIHSLTSWTATDIDNFITNKGYYRGKDDSVTYVNDDASWVDGVDRTGISTLYNMGSTLIATQNSTGVNALIILSAAGNESSFGTSKLALHRYNLFGIGAYDSDWWYHAQYYSSAAESIMADAKLTGTSYSSASSSLYYGGHYGNKNSGMNVMYASDPYWGEKMAANYYALEGLSLETTQDYEANTIGITNQENVEIHKEPNSSADIIYTIKNKNFGVSTIPVIIIDKVYTTESGVTTGYYKVYTDTALDSNRNVASVDYSFDNCYGYINENDLYVVNNQPTITATDLITKVGKTLDLYSNVTASDLEDGNITNSIEVVSSTLDLTKPGEYSVTYKATDSSNFSVSQTIKVTVQANNIPVINASDKTIKLYSIFDPLTGVTASDLEDGTLSVSVVANQVNVNQTGVYEVTYEVTDKDDNKVTKTIQITVSAENARTGIFYFDYLKEIEGSLVLKGYATISGMNNTLDTDFTYTIIYHNVDTGEEYTSDATRITDTSEMTRPIYGEDSYDYTYAWFKASLDIDVIPDGNYNLYLKVKSGDYEVTYLVNNRLYKEEVTSYKKVKSVFIKNDYGNNKGALLLTLRTQTLALKNTGYVYNQYALYRTLEWQDAKLHLYGIAYSYGMDLSTKQTVKRQLILENKATYKTYTYDLGSTTNGLYNVTLPETDNLDKTLAWFDASLDLSEVEVGEYVIYITTTTNVTDIAELTERLNRDVSTINTTLNGKHYAFVINKDRGFRLELIVT